MGIEGGSEQVQVIEADKPIVVEIGITAIAKTVSVSVTLNKRVASPLTLMGVPFSPFQQNNLINVRIFIVH